MMKNVNINGYVKLRLSLLATLDVKVGSPWFVCLIFEVVRSGVG